MIGEELQTKLSQRMSAEQERYRTWLLGQPPDKMLSHALEYAIREDILETVKYDTLPMGQAGTLLKSRTPLADVFKMWRNHQFGYLEGIRYAFERCTDAISYQQQRKSQREER